MFTNDFCSYKKNNNNNNKKKQKKHKKQQHNTELFWSFNLCVCIHSEILRLRTLKKADYGRTIIYNILYTLVLMTYL